MWGGPELRSELSAVLFDIPVNKYHMIIWESSRNMTTSTRVITSCASVSGNAVVCTHTHTLFHASSQIGLFKSLGQMLIKWTSTTKLNSASSEVFGPVGFMKHPGCLRLCYASSKIHCQSLNHQRNEMGAHGRKCSLVVTWLTGYSSRTAVLLPGSLNSPDNVDQVKA